MYNTLMDQSTLVNQLQTLGVHEGDVLMVHSSFRSLGLKDPELILRSLLQALGESGTLLMPALSYTQQPPNLHDNRVTPACVGFLPEYFRLRPGTLRSLHPTHSVCGVGAQVHAWLDDHIEDRTPCGPHSPFNKLFQRGGKILMIGCGLEPNTTMHAIEEYAVPPYLFAPPMIYTLTDSTGRTFDKEYIPHDFWQGRAVQRYDRVEGILSAPALAEGNIGYAKSHLIQAQALFPAALNCLKADPFYFVDVQGHEDEFSHKSDKKWLN